MSGKEAFRWAGKLAVLTGASSGIGEAILKDLVKNGVNVLAIARREEKIKEIAHELRGESGKVFPFKADVTKEAELVSAFDWVESNLKQPVHILVNNAGVSILRNTKDGVIDEWRTQFDTNVLSIGICIREHLKSMKRHNFDGGHIININSIVGSRVVDFPGFYVYSATKHAAKVIAEGVRQELLKEKSITKVTEIAHELRGESGKVFPFKADVTKEAELVSAFDWVESNLKQPVHILVNNAGVSILRNTKDGVIDEWRTQFDTNVLSIGICIREHLKSMKRHNFDGGHIININSIVGSRVVDFPGFYVYSATKHAAKVIAEGVRQELLKEKSITKVTNIQPGYTSTHLWSNAADYSQESVDYLAQFARLESSDVSNAVIYALSLPQHVRIHDLSIQATGEFY